MKDEFDFNDRSPSFNDLVKKYKSVNESADATSDEPVSRLPEPEESADADFEQELNSVFEQFEQPEMPEQKDFTFDDSLIHQDEPKAEKKASAKKEEPKFAYDLNMFGSAPKSTFDFSSLDDSWLDESLDESLFYDPQPVGEEPKKKETSAAVEAANEPAPEPEIKEEIKEEPKISNFVPVNEPEPVDITAGAGGYVAPSNVDSFMFDADSGFDFGDEETAEVSAELEGLPVFTPATPDKKSKKLKGKNETKAVTGFSKDYKVGGEEGNKPAKKGNFFTRNLIPLKGDPTSEIVRKIVMIIAVLAIIGSGGYLFNDYVIAPYMNDKKNDELSSMIGDSNDVIDAKSLAEQYPGVNFPEGMLEKYAALYARNQDFVGWITIDGADISLPVVRGENNEKYLKTDFDGKSNKYGSIFMNCSNSVDTLDYNTTLFGHYMKDEKMFGKLMQYKSASGYKKAPIVEFNTIYGDYKWKIFAVFITNGTTAGDNGYLFNYMFTDLSSNEAVEDFLGEIKLRSIYYPGVDLAVSDKILTLSTCSYEFDEARLVIMARMVRPGESTDVDTSNIRFNQNPRYPQAYYTEKGVSNPYASYSKWYPS